jgi:hypothetical protein
LTAVLLFGVHVDPAVRVRPFHSCHDAVQRHGLGRVVFRRERMMRVCRLHGARAPSGEQDEKNIPLH